MDIHVNDLWKYPLCATCCLARVRRKGQVCDYCKTATARKAEKLAEFLKWKEQHHV